MIRTMYLVIKINENFLLYGINYNPLFFFSFVYLDGWFVRNVVNEINRDTDDSVKIRKKLTLFETLLLKKVNNTFIKVNQLLNYYNNVM